MPPVKSLGERIADALVEDGLLTSAQVEELLEKQKKEGTRFLKLVVEKSYITEQDLVVSMGRVLNTPPINVSRITPSQEMAELIPRDIATNYKVLPIARLGNRLYLAMADPLNVLAVDDVKRITKLEVSPMIASEKAILDRIANLDTARAGSMDEIIQDAAKQAEAEADAESLELATITTETTDLGALAASTGGSSCHQARQSHSRPGHQRSRERHSHRTLREHGPPALPRGWLAADHRRRRPKNLQIALTSRLKVMSSLDISERRLPQDGRMRVKVGGRDIDLRVSFLPTVHGEKCVLRVLDKSNLSASMDKLGIDAETFVRFKSAVDAPHGLILVTGPTGSGKTTTLYSALNELNSPQFNIITVEDPVEFQLPGVNQVPVRKEIGLTFAGALRSILRQDPDIIMIGEIRDSETAEIAVESALTGHQVLSTMHCNDAPGAISRLDDMEIAPFLISSSVILACAQRLMRRICNNCKEPVTYPEKMFTDLGLNSGDFEDGTLFRGRGCERCKNSGYSGRLAIIEAMTMTDEIRKMVIKRASAHEIGKVAVEQGMKTLRMVALEKVREGLSTLEQTLLLTSAEH